MMKGEKKNHAHHIQTQFLRIMHKDFVTWPQLAFLASLSFLATFSSTKLPAFPSKYFVHILCACAEFSAQICPLLYCLPSHSSRPKSNVSSFIALLAYSGV